MEIDVDFVEPHKIKKMIQIEEDKTGGRVTGIQINTMTGKAHISVSVEEQEPLRKSYDLMDRDPDTGEATGIKNVFKPLLKELKLLLNKAGFTVRT